MSKTTKKMPGEITVKRPLLDNFMYWVVQFGLAVAAVAGVKFLLDPVDPVISYPICLFLVFSALYILSKNR